MWILFIVQDKLRFDPWQTLPGTREDVGLEEKSFRLFEIILFKVGWYPGPRQTLAEMRAT